MRIKLFILFWLSVLMVNAQQKQIDYRLNIQYARGFLWAHNKVLKHFENTNLHGVSIDLYRTRLDEDALKYCKKSFHSGFNFNYYNLGKDSLGRSLALNYFIEPNIFNGKYFNSGLKIMAGINYVTNPYNKLSNPRNYFYSTHINGFLSLGISFKVNVTAHHAITALAAYNHFSNGSFKNPNYGVNFPTVNIGYSQYITQKQKPLNQTLQKNIYRIDVYAFGSNKSSPIEKDKRFWPYGAGLLMSKRVALINAITLNTELITDASYTVELDQHNLSHLSVSRVGLLCGHEFIFNHIIFSQQFGVYVYKEIPFFNSFYHRWGLNYRVNNNLMCGINLLANAQKAQFLELRLATTVFGR